MLGGSQGADKLNKSITDSIDFFIKNDLQVILQTGTRYYETYKKFKNKNLIIVPFVDKIEELYSITDLIVSRSGASIISELCIVGKPVIFVPSPNVVDDHQTKNARSIYDNGACEFINEDELDFKLTTIINKLIVSDIYRINLSEKIKAISKKNAVKIILSEIESFLK